MNITTLAQFKAMQPDITANLDNVFRAAVVNQPRIRGIQIAFPDGGWRIYPLVYNLSTFNPLNNTFCNGEDVAPEFRGSAGFKPICRQFYLTAINAYPPSKPGPPNGITPAVFTKPYPSAITGQLLVGASISLYKNKQFYGVISLQILVASLANKLANTPILNNGYIYIIEKGGNVVLYPQSRTSLNIYNADMTTSVSAVEFNSDAGLTTAFLNQVNALKDTNRTGTFKKPDGSTWTFSAATVNSTSHILIVVAPNSDISALSDSMKRSYVTLLAVAVTITVLCTVIAAWISYRVTGSLAQKILNPMESMVANLRNIAVNELHFEFENKPLFSQELNNVNDNFKNLLTAVRFGNTAYYNDDLMLALDNYLAAEAMMIRLGNERGQGVCANNLGNVYRMLDGEFQKAVHSYNRAVAIATNMLNNPSNGEDTQATLRTVLANRLNNMGVLFKENTVDGVLGRIDAANAESFFEKSLALHRQTDNLEGIAQVSGNLGQLYLTPSVNKLAKLKSSSRTRFI
ncbi:hypothetical protein BCR33DRAFT_556985 [Rhizoclosmatium globosum]|uniref:Cache domain-containing protein n=1 Tax=Rhizoclosmatium globosum TaxID=329046 RepID=A0A1Y2CSR4_9FUNG|nr:hypothetical protein BCR33DRAFT_556985 [Rhizoclosmatium globosum]|eukprot:ORY49936.1 hypothetical protein BCR33DRAFT_556985 [Rhizoclosmatium globosum]